MSKILERALNNRLVKYLTANSIPAPNQYGFRAGVSTEDAIRDLLTDAVRTLDRKKKCLTIFLDLSKAFDTVSVSILLKKMETVGVRGIPLEIFKNYLSERTQFVKVGQFVSKEVGTRYGVPQGSILGPTLFLIYINELCKLNIPNCGIYTYADDTALFIQGDSWSETYKNAESALTVVMTWLNTNLLTLNIAKTQYIAFSITPNKSPPGNCILRAHTCASCPEDCACLIINRALTVKYLGILIGYRLDWREHLANLTSRMRRLIVIFKKLRNAADPNVLKTVYYALCQSMVSYCLPVWGGAAKTHLLQVERAQRAVLKVMLRKPFRYPTAQLYADCRVLTVRQLYVLQSVLHKHLVRPLETPSSRVKHRVFSVESHRTTFASRHCHVASSKMYNTINRHLNIFGLSYYLCKNTLRIWLLSLNYDETEDILAGQVEIK